MSNGLKRQKEKDERLRVLLNCDYDELVAALQSHIEIREADEWRPLADHVLSLIELALRRQRDLAEREAAAELAKQSKSKFYGTLYGKLPRSTPWQEYSRRPHTGKPPWPRSS